MFSGQETKRQLVVHGDDSSIAKCRTKPLTIFLGMYGIFRGISILLYIYSRISRENPKDILPWLGTAVLLLDGNGLLRVCLCGSMQSGTFIICYH